MARDVSPPRGMRDFLPADKAKRERALRVIRDVYASHGFEEIETPVVEDFERLHSGLGGDNEKLAFSVLKRGLDKEALEAAANSGDAHDLADLGLRFDLTVPLARFYATHRAELPSVFRAIQIAPVWRAERPQKGRYRQFVQCDIDIIGEAGQLAEVELITATSAVLSTLGLHKSKDHTAPDNHIINRIEQMLNDAYFGGNLGSAYDGGYGVGCTVQDLVNGFDLSRHDIAEHFIIREIFGDKGRGGMGAVGCPESIVNVTVCIGSECFHELFLALFYFGFGCFLFLFGSIFGQISWLAFLFRVEPEVFQ